MLLAVSPPRTEHLSYRDETCDADDERLLTVDLSAAVITTTEMTAARRADVIHHTCKSWAQVWSTGKEVDTKTEFCDFCKY